MTIVCAAPIGSAGVLSSSAIACGIAAASRDADKHTPEIRVFTLLFIRENPLPCFLIDCNEREHPFVTHNLKKIFSSIICSSVHGNERGYPFVTPTQKFFHCPEIAFGNALCYNLLKSTKAVSNANLSRSHQFR